MSGSKAHNHDAPDGEAMKKTTQKTEAQTGLSGSGRKRAAVLGAGALGRLIADGIVHDLADSWELAGIMARTPEHADEAAAALGTCACYSLDDVLALHPDVVVEAAGVGAAAMHGERILAEGCDFILLSAGILADEAAAKRLLDAASASGAHMHVASGAVGGFDILSALQFRQKQLARKGRKERLSVQVDNLKAPGNLNGAPYLAGRELSETEREMVFEGSAREAIAGFPKNVNVAVALAAASAGMDETRVSIVSDPNLSANTHICKADGFGVHVSMEFASCPDPENPRSSSLAAWSVLALLAKLASPIRFF